MNNKNEQIKSVYISMIPATFNKICTVHDDAPHPFVSWNIDEVSRISFLKKDVKFFLTKSGITLVSLIIKLTDKDGNAKRYKIFHETTTELDANQLIKILGNDKDRDGTAKHYKIFRETENQFTDFDAKQWVKNLEENNLVMHETTIELTEFDADQLSKILIKGK